MNFKDTLRFIPKIVKTNMVPMLTGPTGVGKTDLAKQFAAMIGYKLVVLHVAQLEPSDFVGLYKTTADGKTMTCPPNWLPYIKEGQEDDGQGYVIFLDEINRGHEDIRQAMYQFLQTKCIHTYEAPQGEIEVEINGVKVKIPRTIILSAANPAEKYECQEFDDALNNRLAHIDFSPEPEEVLEYLENKYGNNLMVTWLKSDKSLLEMTDDVIVEGKVKFSPRTAENSIKLFLEVENDGVKFQRMALETIMPKDKSAGFFSFLDEIKNINYVDVINGVKSEKISDLLKKNRRDILSTIVHDIGKLLEQYDMTNNTEKFVGVGGLKEMVKGCKVSEKEGLINMANFLSNCPAELCTTFLNLLGDTYEKKGCVLNDPNFAEPLKEKLKGFKDVLRASKKK